MTLEQDVARGMGVQPHRKEISASLYGEGCAPGAEGKPVLSRDRVRAWKNGLSIIVIVVVVIIINPLGANVNHRARGKG